MSNHKLTDEYLDYFERYKRKYGDAVCVLMQVGSFYEMQMVKNETESIGNLDDICSILNIQVTRRNKNIPIRDRSNPYLAGFPKHAASKYLGVLLEHGYTVVVIDQSEDNNKKRDVSAVYSPGVQPVDADQADVYGNVIASVAFEFSRDSIGYSVAFMNMTTNLFEVYESGITSASLFQVLDSLYRLLFRYDLKEVMFIGIGEHPDFIKDTICEYLDIGQRVKVHWKAAADDESFKQFKKLSYQNDTFRRIYTGHVNFGLLEPIEYFHLEKSQLSCLNCMYLLDFVEQHDKQYLQMIAVPTTLEESSHLVLEANTLSQLSVSRATTRQHKFGSLFDVLNKTRTAVGKRALKSLLTKPFRDAQEITRRMDISDAFEAHFTEEVVAALEGICDFERLHRKMSLGVLQPTQFATLHGAYIRVLELDKLLGDLELPQLRLLAEDFLSLEKYVSEYSKVLNLDSDCLFARGYTPEIDELYSKIQSLEQQIAGVCQRYNDLVKNDFFKLYVTEEGHFLTCTKIRSQLLKKALSDEDYSKLRIKTNTSTCRITTDELQKLSMDLMNNRDAFDHKVASIWKKYTQTLYNANFSLFERLKTFVEMLDVTQSNVRCKTLYGYSRPRVVEGDESYFEAKQLRHPIIERVLTGTPYVPNDIKLTKEEPGIVLYALNSCGKSSLLRSVGLCVVMAQCGMYVPCEDMTFSPFDTIVTQVDMHDNMWKAQSSFIVEMKGLRNILRVADKKCLVLCDELTKGTEVVSATSIFAASVLELAKRSCKFLFTTHLQEVANIVNSDAIQICHLSVDIRGDSIVFERILRPGPTTSLYGLEVARAVGVHRGVLESAFDIRDKLTGETNSKPSRYNKAKRLEACEICGYRPTKKTDIPLDTHHIKFQHTADKNRFTGHYHVNSKFNLVCLCKSCHNAVHLGTLDVKGYVQTTDGVKLEYTRL